MLLILDRKNIGIMKGCGSGEKVGEVELWLSRELEEPEEPLMDIATDYIPLLFMPILWRNILFLR